MNRLTRLTLIVAAAAFVTWTPCPAQDSAKSDTKATPPAEASEEGSKAKTDSTAPGQTDEKAQPPSTQGKDAAAGEKASSAPQPAETPTLHPRVKLETTVGNIVLELDGEKAPVSTMNFIRYAKEGYYDGTIFHRVIKDFMIQGGGFTADVDKKTQGLHAPIKNEWRNGLKNVRGTVSMARLGGNPDSATSQFFINVVNNPALDSPQADGAAYAVFGKVVDGMEVVDEIRNTKVQNHPKYPSRQPVTPATPVVIESVKVLSNVDEAAAKANMEKSATSAVSEKEKAMKDALATIELETGNPIVRTDSGLMYSIIKEGDGPSPNPTDTVQVNYRGTFLDGKEFDSSYKRGRPAEFALNKVIPGWTEGVGMMKVGGSRYLVVPPDLGYGSRPNGPIPANSTLVFKIELLGIM